MNNDHRLPCVVFGFNRPNKLARVLNALNDQKINRLIIFIDGPRNQADILKVDESKSLAQKVNWVDTELHFWEVNHGLERLSENISQVFEKYTQAVFLEDDCLPMPGFYPFLIDALVRYREEFQVFSIGGYQTIVADYFKAYPYNLVSSARFTCWGWATWRDRWHEIQPLLGHYSHLFNELQDVSEIAGQDLAGMARGMATGNIQLSWDVPVAISTLWLKKSHLLVSRGLVKNIGLDHGGSHGALSMHFRDRWLHNRNLSQQMPTKLEWLEDTRVNCDYSLEFQEYLYKTQALSPRKQLRRLRSVVGRRISRRKERLFDLCLTTGFEENSSKRALLSYIVHPFSISREDPRFYRHINNWHAQEIVRTLNRLGYLVDVINYNDTEFIPQKVYDCFIGHGGMNFEKVSNSLPRSTQRIYFSTGAYWRFHNEQEKLRFEALFQRQGVRLALDRYIKHEEETALENANGIIGFGNSFIRQTYASFPKTYLLNSTALYDDFFEWCPKDFESGMGHFLFYSGKGCVHKGLDLLLEVFPKIDAHLWISSKLEKDFEHLYWKEIHQTSNIHMVGWTQPRSKNYYKLMNQCNFCILPSCSEGSPQSVVECMNHGLIPLVSRAAGLDVETCGAIIEPCTIDEISSTISRFSELPVETIQSISKKARTAVLNDYSEANFTDGFRAALLELGI